MSSILNNCNCLLKNLARFGIENLVKKMNDELQYYIHSTCPTTFNAQNI